MSQDPPSEPTPDAAADEVQPALAGGVLLRGTPVAHGLAIGVVHRKDHDLLRARTQRVPRDQVEGELNRFSQALRDSRQQLDDLRSKLRGRVPADHARILDTHVAYLKDSVFLSDVENLILNEQMSLEAAIVKVVSDFDRIFRLIENDTLRERAVDLRDVGIRVLRNLQLIERAELSVPAPRHYVLVARELSIVDMFNLSNEHVQGIVTEEGGLTSHAAILARSMRIPTLTGVESLLETVHEGDHVILDASEGVVRINPDERVREQYLEAGAERAREEREDGAATWSREPTNSADRVAFELRASCGNLPEVEQAAAAGAQGVGLYRTELLFLVDKQLPSLDSLVAHYRSVVELAGGEPVTFRLLHVDSSLEVGYLHEHREANPALGRRGVRALLDREQVLRRQIQAILRACAGLQEARIALPFVIDCGELRRVKEVLFDERIALRRDDAVAEVEVKVGVVLETPVAALGVQALAREGDFVVVGLDSLVQGLMSADRENHDLRTYFEPLHPVVLRVLADVVGACRELDAPLSVYGVSAVSKANLPLLAGIGLRELSVAPVALEGVRRALQQLDVGEATRAARHAASAVCQADTLTLVDGYRHGFAGP